MERAYVQYVAPDIVDWVIFENDIGTELTASFCLHFNEINQFSLGFYVVFNVFIMENGIPSSQAVSDMLTETIFFRLTGGLIEMAREYIYIYEKFIYDDIITLVRYENYHLEVIYNRQDNQPDREFYFEYLYFD